MGDFFTTKVHRLACTTWGCPNAWSLSVFLRSKQSRHYTLIVILFGLLLIAACTSKAQPPTQTETSQETPTIDSTQYKFTYQIDQPHRFFSTDKLKQVYLVSTDNELIKYGIAGQPTFTYNNNRLGELAFIDVTDPFNILLFYPEYFTIILLDRTLSETAEYNLFDLQFQDIPAVGISRDNYIYIFDKLTDRLKKINKTGITQWESSTLQQLINRADVEPKSIIERENFIYLNDPALGIFVFDEFGQYLRTVDLQNLEDLQVVNDYIFYAKSGRAYSFQLKTLTNREIPLPSATITLRQFRLQKQTAFFSNGESVLIYELLSK